jgi:phage terminase large subunit
MQSQGYWKDSLWNATDSIYTFETGNQIEFFSTDNADKLRGARRDWLFMNEANNNSFDAFEQLEVRTKKGIFIDYNPTNEFWVQNDLMGKRDDIEFIILTYKDNEALSDEIIKSIEQRKNRPHWWQVYGLGQLGELEGKIYKNWLIIDELPHEAKLERYGLDFGYTNDPTAIVGVYKYNNAYILDEVCYTKGMSNKEIADTLKDVDRALVIADSAEPKSIDEIRAYGINILPATKGQGSVKQGVQYVQNQQISITKRFTNLIKEYRNYMWVTDKDGKVLNEPEDIWNHAMDAVRYAFNSLKPKQDDIQIKLSQQFQRNTNNYSSNSTK